MLLLANSLANRLAQYGSILIPAAFTSVFMLSAWARRRRQRRRQATKHARAELARDANGAALTCQAVKRAEASSTHARLNQSSDRAASAP